MTKLLLTDEAIALGAINAGISGVYAYPGTPSTEVTEFIQLNPLARERGIFSRWCTNEKTAMEAALGMSFAGGRALVCMKHVGLNVCADPFINSSLSGVNGGVVVLVADDPSMHSSQNEQDSRHYGRMAMVPVLEPSNQQEAYDMMGPAFEMSENLHLPVLLRVVTRLAHSRADVCTAGAAPKTKLPVSTERGWVLLPGIARKQFASLLGKQERIRTLALESPYNSVIGSGRIGIIACGVTVNYVREAMSLGNLGDIRVLKISQYPLSRETVLRFAEGCDSILVTEDGSPFVESQVRDWLEPALKVLGRVSGELPLQGELSPDCVCAALGVSSRSQMPELKEDVLMPRPPQLCKGCGHRDVYASLVKVMEEFPDGRIFGDIGCYTLGALPPYKALATCIDMGASITMAKGASDAGLWPAVAVIGDSTFTHSGMTGLLDAVNSSSPITVIISDNLTTAMTGGQDSAGTSRYEGIVKALGVEEEHVHTVVPMPTAIDSIAELIRKEINYKGVSVIILRRECIQTARRHAKASKNQ